SDAAVCGLLEVALSLALAVVSWKDVARYIWDWSPVVKRGTLVVVVNGVARSGYIAGFGGSMITNLEGGSINAAVIVLVLVFC
ncbi:anion permease, partial [Escherichia coli]|uniref:anion permease n=1 Tax=Escherichia coli TaxID=562 RepID=UPI0013545C71